MAHELSQRRENGESSSEFEDNRPEAIAQRQLKEGISNGPSGGQPIQEKGSSELVAKENNTGLPDKLKGGIENLSGYSMDDVKVHYNSDKPAQLQAHAYAQGTDIHIASGQEKHLPHEAWHVVQQKQGRVKPTMQMKGKVNINDDIGLEKEADVMGERAENSGSENTHAASDSKNGSGGTTAQRMLVGIEMETNVPIYENGARPDHLDGYAAQTNEYDHANVDEVLRQPLGRGFEIHVDSGSGAPDSALRVLNPGAKMHIMEIVSKPVASREALLLKLQTARNFLKIIQDYSEVTGGGYSVGWPIPSASWSRDGEAEDLSVEALENVFSNDYETGKGRLFSVASQLTFQVPPDHLKHLADQDTKTYNTGRSVMGSRKTRKLVYDKELGKKVMKNVEVPVRRPEMAEHPIVDRDSMAEAMLFSDALENKYIRRVVDITVKIFKDTLKLIQGEVLGTVKNSVSHLVRSDFGALFSGFPPEMAAGMAGDVAGILELTTIKELNIPKRLLSEIYDEENDGLILNSRTFRSIVDPPEREAGELEHINEGLRASLARTNGQYWPWKEAMRWLGAEVGSAIIQGGRQTTGPLHGSQNLGILPERNVETEVEELEGLEAATDAWQESPHDSPYPDQVVEEGDHDLGEAEPSVVVEDRAGLGMEISGDELPDNVVTRLNQMGFPD